MKTPAIHTRLPPTLALDNPLVDTLTRAANMRLSESLEAVARFKLSIARTPEDVRRHYDKEAAKLRNRGAFNYRRSGKGAVAKLTRRVYQDMAQAVATDGVLIAEKMAEIARPGRVEWVEAVQ